MRKRASAARIERFQRDFQKLRETQSNDELARKLDFDPANLSSYGSGKKKPGEEFINRFYEVFGEEIGRSGYDQEPIDGEQLSEVNEPPLTYLSKNERGIIDELKMHSEHLRSNFDKIVASNLTLAESNRNISQSNLILAQTNEKLIDKLR